MIENNVKVENKDKRERKNDREKKIASKVKTFYIKSIWLVIVV